MPIEFFCPGCGKLMRTPDDTGGRKGRCPSCQTKVLIPESSVLASSLQADSGSQPAPTAGDTISLTCQQCGRLLQVPSASAGKKGQCPQCATVMSIPTAAEAAQAGRDAPSGPRWKEPRKPASVAKPVATEKPASGKIEFRCSHCQKLVRVVSSAAGQMGQCPKCKAVIKIPAKSAATPGRAPTSGSKPQAAAGVSPIASGPSTGLTPLDSGLAPLESGLTPLDSGLTPLDSGLTPLDSGLTPPDSGLTPLGSGPTSGGSGPTVDSASGLTPLPEDSGLTPLVSNDPIASDDPFAALKPAAGSQADLLGASGSIPAANTYASAPLSPIAKQTGKGSLSFTGIMDESWKAFTDNLGTCVGVSLIMMGISGVLGGAVFALYWTFLIVMAIIAPQIGVTAAIVSLIIFIVLMVLICAAFQMWMWACMIHLAVEVVQGKAPGVGDAFKGGRYMGPILVSQFLIGLMMIPGVLIVGALLAIAKSFLIAILSYVFVFILSWVIWLMFSLAPFFIVGERKNAIEALSLSAKYSLGVLPVYVGVMVVFSLGLTVFSAATCSIGLIFCLMLLPITQAVVYKNVRRL